MDVSNQHRAEILVEALPYIRKYNNKVLVIKYGGNAMINETLKQQVMEDVALLHLIGVKVVLVHGGGPEISDTLRRIGKEAAFVDGLRVTDRETVEVVQMVLAGKINKTLVKLWRPRAPRPWASAASTAICSWPRSRTSAWATWARSPPSTPSPFWICWRRTTFR